MVHYECGTPFVIVPVNWERMARKPTLSPTKISTYLACPSKYRWTYVDPRGRYYLRAKHYFSFGTSLHRVLERLHDAGDAGVKTVDQVTAALEESWVDAGYRSPQEMQEAMGEGKAILTAYVEQLDESPPAGVTVMVERMLRVDLGRFILVGRVDRVDQWPDGTLQIVDYKSGRSAVTPEEVRHDLAMSCYQLLVRERFPGQPVVASIIALRAGTAATASLEDDELTQFQADLLELSHTILDRDYDHLVPVANPLCPTCDFLKLCRQHPEYDEAALLTFFDPPDPATEPA